MSETQAQYRARILRHVAGREPLPLLAAAPATLAALLATVPPALCARRPAPRKWSIQEIVAHLAADELVGAYRVRLILAAPGTAIQAFDQDLWAETGRYAATDPWRSLALFRMLREANLALWQRLSPAEWERAGVHAERGVESIRDIAAYYAGHDLNHFAQIEAILASARTAP
jgi:hypothetical protein